MINRHLNSLLNCDEMAPAESHEIRNSRRQGTMKPDDNPFAPPRAVDPVVGVKSGRVEDLKTVAVAQKTIIVSKILTQNGYHVELFGADLSRF
jgi:hypothetical protein